MADFTETKLRFYCRNSKCRSKLPSPVGNEREAFCTRGCYGSFYLHRCVVCEKRIERKREDQKVCRSAKCRNAWRAGVGFGRYAASSDAKSAQKVPDFIDPKRPLKPDRTWRIVAGPELSPSAFHCATVPDGPDCQWRGGEHDRVEASDTRLLEAHFAELDRAMNHCADCGREDDLVDRKLVTLCRPCRDARLTAPVVIHSHVVPADLSIPVFLDRRPTPLPLAA
jgi:hypothetical protein